MSGDDLTYPAQAYRAAIAFGMKKQEEKLGLMAENARLRAAVADLQAELGVWKVQSINEAERAREEAERLRAENEALKVCQCESCDESLEGEAYCVKCFERLRSELDQLARETMGITAAGAKAYEEAERLRAEMAEMRRRVNQDAPYSSMMAVTEDWQRRAVNAECEVERLRADWGAALDTASFLRDDLTKARTEAERLEEKWKAFDSLRVEAMNKADAWREEAERLRAALDDAERNLEDAGRWAQQAELATTQIRKTADAYKKYRAIAGTEALAGLDRNPKEHEAKRGQAQPPRMEAQRENAGTSGRIPVAPEGGEETAEQGDEEPDGLGVGAHPGEDTPDVPR